MQFKSLIIIHKPQRCTRKVWWDIWWVKNVKKINTKSTYFFVNKCCLPYALMVASPLTVVLMWLYNGDLDTLSSLLKSRIPTLRKRGKAQNHITTSTLLFRFHLPKTGNIMSIIYHWYMTWVLFQKHRG